MVINILYVLKQYYTMSCRRYTSNDSNLWFLDVFQFFFPILSIKRIILQDKNSIICKKKKNVLDKNEITKKLFHN